MTNLDAEIEQWLADFARFREMVAALYPKQERAA